jgi:hypothetical protein
MPIRHFINGGMGQAEIERLNIAFAKALRMLDLVDRSDPSTKMIGEKIVDVGTSGITDPQDIAEIVVSHFREVPS